MLIRADHEHFTSKQFARHEIGHDKIAKGQVDIKAVRKRLEEKVGKEAIDSVAQTYAEAYGRTGLDADEVWEECICDSLGDMNIFTAAGLSGREGRVTDKMLAEIKAVTESETKAPTQTRGSPEGKASRATEESNTDNEKESELYETREETRDEFNRAAHEANCTVDERGQIAYAYKVSGQPSSKGQKVADELGKLGIKGIIHEGLKSNSNGITTIYDAGASTFAGVCVFIDNEIGRNPVETAGHEAFHYWVGTPQNITYTEIIADNIVFSSKEFTNFQSKIAKDYFGEEIPLDDKRWPLLAEEIPAYITGYIYSGDVDNIVRPFLRDYDEVKTAMDSFFASQQGEGKASRELDLIDYINERAEIEAVTRGEIRGHIASEKDLSNRELLASALESITSYPSERGILTDYRAMLETIGKAERRITDIDSDIKVLSKDKKNAEYVKLLKKEKASLTEEIHLADKRLLKLESAKALKKVMEREKARATEQGKKDQKRSPTKIGDLKLSLFHHFFCKLADKLCGAFYTEGRGVYSHIIVIEFSPFIAGVEVVVCRATLVGFADGVNYLCAFKLWVSFPYACLTVVEITVNKKTQNIGLVAKNIISASADINATAFLCIVSNNLGLKKKQLVVQGHFITEMHSRPKSI